MPPLVLIPGLASDQHLFAAQVKALKGLLPVNVADIRSGESIAAFASGILAQSPPHFAVAGLSMGGYIALEIMRLAPARITRLALLDTSARPDSEEATQRRLRMISLARLGQLEDVHRLNWPRLVHPAHAANRELEEVVRTMLLETGAEAYERQQRAVMGRMDSRPFLPAIRVPTLVLVGEQDVITPADHAREMAEAIPGARLETIPESGHLSALEKPDAVTAALRAWIEG